jgi:NAD(P)-dependent dehydrogenase (short-subunit alcohol dehydrogenase family)
MATYDVSGKVVLITGAARGIGNALARQLRARGAMIAVVDLRPDDVERAVEELGGDPVAIGFHADVTDRGAMQRVVAQTVERFGGLDVVVANAGIVSRAATMSSMATETFDRIIDVNVNGVVHTVQAALPQVVERRGQVIVISSVMAFANSAGSIPYGMSKAAVEALARGLRVELVPLGASATSVHFGFIDTDMVQRALDTDPVVSGVLESFPRALRKRLKPEQAAAAVVTGIETRAPRVITPGVWKLFFALRGIIGPLLDRRAEHDAGTRASMAALHGRDGEELEMTA